VWKISSAENVLYIGGTIHILSASDYPLPDAFESAYSQADNVVFETDIQLLQEPAFQQKMSRYLLYPKGTTLEQKLDYNTHQALNEYLIQEGLSMQSLNRFKPGYLATSLTLRELQKLGMTGTGVDQFFSDRALQEQKPQAKLETALSQIEKIAMMGEGQENAFIRHTLSELESLPSLLKDMKVAWRTGDTEQLKKIALDPLTDFPDIYQALMVDRNMAWLPSIVSMIESEPVEFILVGAAHLVGKDGLLQQLEKRGYRVEQQQ